MFKNSTTIWHQPPSQKNFFAEKRLIHAAAPSVPAPSAAGSIKEGFNKGWGKVVNFGKGAKNVITSKPVRWGLFPGTIVASASLKIGGWAYEKVARFARFGKELGIGAKETVIDPLLRIVKAPFIFLKKNLIDNTRDGIKAIFQTTYAAGKGLVKAPGNIKRIPRNLILGGKEAVTDTRKEIGDTFKHITDLSPIKAINGVRRSVLSALAMPFKTVRAPLRPLAFEPLKEMIEPNAKVVKNVYDSVAAYPRGIAGKEAGNEGAFYKTITGIRRMVGAWAATITPVAQPAAA